ncbi:hotdog domain-containing protein [Sulfurovum sp.]|uniref:hotdog domain-containing protein n=1 Tax=Sulfurovum sp. TaxID=1969726 RepID=UPI0025CEBBF5|nr:hotdog domain-containing protein [Sulfurovum sp.]
MKLNTHLQIDNALCGKVIKLEEGHAQVLLHTTQQMRVDAQGLVHGGFVFGAADYTAMVVVNDPLVVLGSASSKFIAPVRVGDVVLFEGKLTKQKGKKAEVRVEAFVEEKRVFESVFTAFVLEQHVLANKGQS